MRWSFGRAAEERGRGKRKQNGRTRGQKSICAVVDLGEPPGKNGREGYGRRGGAKCPRKLWPTDVPNGQHGPSLDAALLDNKNNEKKTTRSSSSSGSSSSSSRRGGSGPLGPTEKESHSQRRRNKEAHRHPAKDVEETAKEEKKPKVEERQGRNKSSFPSASYRRSRSPVAQPPGYRRPGKAVWLRSSMTSAGTWGVQIAKGRQKQGKEEEENNSRSPLIVAHLLYSYTYCVSLSSAYVCMCIYTYCITVFLSLSIYIYIILYSPPGLYFQRDSRNISMLRWPLLLIKLQCSRPPVLASRRCPSTATRRHQNRPETTGRWAALIVTNGRLTQFFPSLCRRVEERITRHRLTFLPPQTVTLLTS